MESLLARARAVLASQPFSILMGAELIAFSEDEVEIRLPVSDKIKQQYGFVHGGVISYLADNALTFAGGAALMGRGQIVTSEMKINYLRPAYGEYLIARAKTVSTGRTQSVARCEVYAMKDGEEKICAAAQGTITAAAPHSAQAP
jgi:uncharacterized protein (TIGR00369 family)